MAVRYIHREIYIKMVKNKVLPSMKIHTELYNLMLKAQKKFQEAGLKMTIVELRQLCYRDTCHAILSNRIELKGVY